MELAGAWCFQGSRGYSLNQTSATRPGGELVLTKGSGRSMSKCRRADGEDWRRSWAELADEVAGLELRPDASLGSIPGGPEQRIRG